MQCQGLNWSVLYTRQVPYPLVLPLRPYIVPSPPLVSSPLSSPTLPVPLLCSPLYLSPLHFFLSFLPSSPFFSLLPSSPVLSHFLSVPLSFPTLTSSFLFSPFPPLLTSPLHSSLLLDLPVIYSPSRISKSQCSLSQENFICIIESTLFLFPTQDARVTVSHSIIHHHHPQFLFSFLDLSSEPSEILALQLSLQNGTWPFPETSRCLLKRTTLGIETQYSGVGVCHCCLQTFPFSLLFPFLIGASMVFLKLRHDAFSLPFF